MGHRDRRARAVRRARRASAVALAVTTCGLVAGSAQAAPTPAQLQDAIQQLTSKTTSALTTKAKTAEAPAAADAAEWTKPFDCQTNYPGALLCFQLQTTSGNAQVGSFKASLDKSPISLAGGLDANLSPIPAAPGSGSGGGGGFPTIDVPGGVTGIQPLQDLLDRLALGGLTGVKAAFAPVGTPGFGLDLGTGEIGASLQLYVKVQSLLLGNDCSIGTAKKPIALNPKGGIDGIDLQADHIRLALHLDDDTFTVPGAANCGPLGLGGLLTGAKINLLDGIINSRLGLPAGSGRNHLNLKADLVLFP
ncbi:hypothetical protein [Patulibacter defluvii]|uniref:hypothetical protein n=1 Tax=Patulibacter defluvii TaxID=3095358 RepID=UPI002A7648B8|nr:hypothetical protein [Patulibacter sp. DM4]